MRLRRANLADLPELADLERACFPLDAWGEGALGAEIVRPNTVLLVVEEEGRLLGSLVAWWILDELEILRVAVAPEARRRGAGRAMMLSVETEIPDLNCAFLEVRADNPGAIALYESIGYRPNGRRPRYYADGCDALLYRKEGL